MRHLRNPKFDNMYHTATIQRIADDRASNKSSDLLFIDIVAAPSYFATSILRIPGAFLHQPESLPLLSLRPRLAAPRQLSPLSCQLSEILKRPGSPEAALWVLSHITTWCHDLYCEALTWNSRISNCILWCNTEKEETWHKNNLLSFPLC